MREINDDDDELDLVMMGWDWINAEKNASKSQSQTDWCMHKLTTVPTLTRRSGSVSFGDSAYAHY